MDNLGIDPNNGWREWSRLVLTKLKDHDSAIEGLKSDLSSKITESYDKVDRKLDERYDKTNEKLSSLENKITKLDRDLLVLKTRASIWGGVAGGVITTIIGVIMKWL